jgi:hypothetical protein
MIKKKKVEKVENIEERFKHDGPGPRLSSVLERKLYWRGEPIFFFFFFFFKWRANFWKKARGIVLKPLFQTSLYFLDTDCSIFKTHYKDYIFVLLKDI